LTSSRKRSLGSMARLFATCVLFHFKRRLAGGSGIITLFPLCAQINVSDDNLNPISLVTRR
jgi:hypothetical protein